MIAADQHGPGGRTFEEDDEEEYFMQSQMLHHGMQSIPGNKYKLECNACRDASECNICAVSLFPSVKTVVTSFDHTARPYGMALVASLADPQTKPSATIASVITLPHGGHRDVTAAHIYVLGVVMVVVVLDPVPDSDAHLFVSLVLGQGGRLKDEATGISTLSLNEEQSKSSSIDVIGIGSFALGSYNGDGREGGLRKIMTRQYMDATLDSIQRAQGILEAAAIAAKSVAPLNEGNVLTGLAAAFLCWCELHSTTALLLLSLTRPAVTVDSMRAFSCIEPLFQAIIQSAYISAAESSASSSASTAAGDVSGQDAAPSRKFKAPSMADYNYAIRHDQYALDTESLYC